MIVVGVELRIDDKIFLLNRREDGRLEIICPHNIGHTIFAPKGSDYVHGCDGCEKTIPLELKYIVASIRDIIPCRICGKMPIEWHNPEHDGHSHRRISSLVNRGSYISVLEEIRKSIPLCRSCHMKEDGRLAELKKNQPHKQGKIYVGKQPCVCCSKNSKPLRNGLCYNCYEKHRVGGRNYKGHTYSENCCKRKAV